MKVKLKKRIYPKKIVKRSHPAIHEGRPGIFSLCLFSFFHGVSLRVFERLCNFLIAQLTVYFPGEKVSSRLCFFGCLFDVTSIKAFNHNIRNVT